MSEPTPEDVPLSLPPDQQGWKGTPSASTDGLARLTQELRQVKAELRELRGAAPLRAAGIGMAPEGMTIDSNLAITGTLSLPNGIIDNDALANPVTIRSAYGNSDGFAVTTSPVQMAAFKVNAPAGFTKAFYFANGSCQVYNNGTTTVYAYLRVNAKAPNGYHAWGSRQLVALPPQFGGTITATLYREVSSPLTDGAVLDFYVEVHASATLAFTDTNFAFCETGVVFTR